MVVHRGNIPNLITFEHSFDFSFQHFQFGFDVALRGVKSMKVNNDLPSICPTRFVKKQSDDWNRKSTLTRRGTVCMFDLPDRIVRRIEFEDYSSELKCTF